MQEIQILYAVTGTVIALLVAWVGYVLVRAPRFVPAAPSREAPANAKDAPAAPAAEARDDGADTHAG